MKYFDQSLTMWGIFRIFGKREKGMREKTLDDFTGKEILRYVAENFSVYHIFRYLAEVGKITITDREEGVEI